MTVKELVVTAVSGLKKEYLSPAERTKLEDYILDNSTLSVTRKHLELESASLIGIGKDAADKTIPDFKFISFFWGDLDLEYETVDGLTSREWYLIAHKTLEDMERVIIARSLDWDANIPSGEMVAIINGKVVCYKIQSKGASFPSKELSIPYIEWVDQEPYEVRFKDCLVDLTETYPSQYQSELRVLQLLCDCAKDVHVIETLTNRELHFSVTQNVYDTRPLPGDTDLNIMWHLWEVLDFVN